MPLTLYHLGPGAALYALAPRHVSLLAFCAVNVLIDIESFYYMFLATNLDPADRFVHTYVGATIVTAATAGLFLLALRPAAKRALPNVFRWQELTLSQVVVGAAAGSYSHVLFDSVMHAAIRPLWPFGTANVLHRVISVDALHASCIASGVLAGVVIAVRARLRGRRPA